VGEKHGTGTRKQTGTCWRVALLSAVLLAAAAAMFAQNAAKSAKAAQPCGPDGEHFAVTTDFEDHPLEKTDGKAIVYFLQDDGQSPRITVRWRSRWRLGRSYTQPLLFPYRCRSR